MTVLVVTNPFGGHEIGARITGPEEIAKILAGEHAHVVRATHADVHTAPKPVIPADEPEPDPTDTEEA